MLSFPLVGGARAEDKIGVAVEAPAQTESSLEVRGNVTNPHRIDAAELRRLPRAETRTPDSHNPGKEIVYSGTPLIEVLKASGLRLESGEAGFRETVSLSLCPRYRIPKLVLAQRGPLDFRGSSPRRESSCNSSFLRSTSILRPLFFAMHHLQTGRHR
jgi:hypothetical protein